MLPLTAWPYEADDEDPEPQLEKWYLDFGIGYSYPMYGDALQKLKDSLGGSSAFPIDLEFGYYRPLARTFVAGVVENAVVDSFGSDPTTSQSITRFLTGLSAQYFFTGGIVGEGFFARADAGLSTVMVTAPTGTNTPPDKDRSLDFGFGFQCGLGYGLGISDHSRVLFEALFAERLGSAYSAGDLTLGASFLF